MTCAPVEPVKDAVSAPFRAKVWPPGNLELGELERSDGVFGAIVALIRSLDRTLQVPGINAAQQNTKATRRWFCKHGCKRPMQAESCPCVSRPAL